MCPLATKRAFQQNWTIPGEAEIAQGFIMFQSSESIHLLLHGEFMLLTPITANGSYECKCDTSLGEWTACANEANCSERLELEIIVMSHFTFQSLGQFLRDDEHLQLPPFFSR